MTCGGGKQARLGEVDPANLSRDVLDDDSTPTSKISFVRQGLLEGDQGLNLKMANCSAAMQMTCNISAFGPQGGKL